MNLVGFCNVDWAGNVDDRKSTSEGCFYLRNNLISQYSKKQNAISLSTAEVEYIATGSFCTQLLWMKQMLKDYGILFDCWTLYCDNTSCINIYKKPVQHSRTKHISIRHYFIRELVENKTVVLEYAETEKQFADVFTQALDFVKFDSLRKALRICIMQNIVSLFLTNFLQNQDLYVFVLVDF